MMPFSHMLSPTRLRVLAKLAEHGSFSEAADALDYTQSAVSKQVAALEREVGMQLVLREVRPVRLTAAGEALAVHAQAVLERLAAAEAELEAIGELDLAVVFDFPALGLTVDEGIEGHHLLDDPNDLLVHPEHRLARRRRVTFADLREEDWLFPTLGPDSPTQKLFTAACSGAGYEPRIVFRVNDCEMFQALVAADMGIGFLPRIALHPVHPGVVVKPVADSPTRRILAVTLAGARSLASKAFLELLAHYAAAYPELRQPARV